MVTSPTEHVHVDETDGYATITFARPEKRNAVDLEIIDGLLAVVEQVITSGDRGILFVGEGPVTCAGADLGVLTGENEDAKRRLIGGFCELFDALQSYARPTVMAARGAVVGGACQLAAVCDATVIGEETAYYKPEIQYGVMSQYATALLKHVAGPRAAREITLTGTPIPPERVAALGLAVEVVPEEDVEATARELAADLCAHDGWAYGHGKAVFEFEKSPEDFPE